MKEAFEYLISLSPSLVIDGVYDYYISIEDKIGTNNKEKLNNTIMSIKEIKVGEFNTFKDGILTIRDNFEVGVVFNLIYADAFKSSGTEWFYMLMFGLLVGKNHEDKLDLKMFKSHNIEWLHTWDSGPTYMEDYLRRFNRHYKKIFKCDIDKNYYEDDFYNKYVSVLSDKEKDSLKSFACLMADFITKLNKDEEKRFLYSYSRKYYYAWCSLQRMEESRKIKPSCYYDEDDLGKLVKR